MRLHNDTPAGKADSYTERIKAARAREVEELDKSEEKRPVKHISTAMYEFVLSVQAEVENSQE